MNAGRAAALLSAERNAMAEISATTDVLTIGGKLFIVAEVSQRTLDTLAAFGAADEDAEPGPDDEPDHDGEPSLTGVFGTGDMTMCALDLEG